MCGYGHGCETDGALLSRTVDPGPVLALAVDCRVLDAAARAWPGVLRMTQLGLHIRGTPAGTRATRFHLARECIWRNALGKYSRTFYMRK